MEPTALAFKDNARKAIANPDLQDALGRIRSGWQVTRRRAALALDEFEALRDRGRDIKNHTLAHLDLYLEAFEAKVEENGGRVHWARDAAEARTVVRDICKEAGAKTVTKSKSMVTEEIALNPYLEANGLTPVETDLGEWILQVSGQAPSHLVGPVVHLTKPEIAGIMQKELGGPRLETAEEMVGAARRVLRQKYQDADVGITGANFLVAETGTAITVTNEGNAELTHGLPRVHVVIATIEKLVPRMLDAFTLLRLLARSATGQEFTSYTTLVSGPKGKGDLDGPEAFHVVLLDNGRTKMLGTAFQEMLRCIKCGACMNHCPVYLAAGGHSYGWVYPGPMGSVLTPQLLGIEKAHPLPNASTFCGRCEEVCPVRIPLPRLMRLWREEAFRRDLVPPTARRGLRLWGWLAARPALYRRAAGLASGALRLLGGRRGRLRRLPLAGGWTGSRDLPAPEGGTFMAAWKRQQGRRP
ncbi:MAG: lactate utilization protein [Geminicoccaceae bacterium]|nr:lactate utilization protein [Geminicoccaceae bacterium]